MRCVSCAYILSSRCGGGILFVWALLVARTLYLWLLTTGSLLLCVCVFARCSAHKYSTVFLTLWSYALKHTLCDDTRHATHSVRCRRVSACLCPLSACVSVLLSGRVSRVRNSYRTETQKTIHYHTPCSVIISNLIIAVHPRTSTSHRLSQRIVFAHPHKVFVTVFRVV